MSRRSKASPGTRCNADAPAFTDAVSEAAATVPDVHVTYLGGEHFLPHSLQDVEPCHGPTEAQPARTEASGDWQTVKHLV